RAGGFISGRFLTGIKPQEYFFHCMAGREGLIDTAVKTSRSGYLQRCLIKHLESLRVHYDHTVRDSDGSIIQFHYGEDSLDVIKQKYLFMFQFMARNNKALMLKYDISEAQKSLNTSWASIHAKKADRKKNAYDPVLSVYSPSTFLGSVSEKFHKALEKVKYMEDDSDKIFKDDSISKPAFRKLMHLKYLHSLVEPGEAVGLLAAQGIGEPSTQMTLNTFHFAGFGAKNVTLGIPRLREIIMTASQSIKTPLMTLPLLDSVSDREALKFCQKISKLTLAEVVDRMVVTERILGKREQSGFTRCRAYKIHMQFYTREEYTEEFDLRPWQIERVIEIQFLYHLENAITKLSKSSSKRDKSRLYDDVFEVGKPSKRSKKEETYDDDVPINDVGYESDNGDGDATNVKINARSHQFASYDAPDDEDLEIIKQNDRALEYEDFDSKIHADTNDGEPENLGDDDTQDLVDYPKNLEKKTKSSRRNKILCQLAYVTNYQFDSTEGSWCDIELELPVNMKKLLLLDIAEVSCKKSVIHEISGITKCYPIPNETKEDTLKNVLAEGVNFQRIWLYNDLIDINKIYTNDIAAVLKTYGVEAARSTIIKEISSVFSSYGINVDPRHLTLVADYMTFEGQFKPFNRMGIDSNPSPLLKMSFESTCNFLAQATLFGDVDMLSSPSARLALGKVVQGGTGSFEIRQPCETLSAN
ncbi:15003_t:CDS:2, partial [Acaulospora colombiana]